MDTYGKFRLVNLIRKLDFPAGSTPSERAAIAKERALASANDLHTSDELLHPVLEGDMLLRHLAEVDSDWSDSEDDDAGDAEHEHGDAEDNEKEEVVKENVEQKTSGANQDEELRRKDRELQKLRNQVAELSEAMQKMRAYMQQTLQVDGEPSSAPETKSSPSTSSTSASTSTSTSASSSATPTVDTVSSSSREPTKADKGFTPVDSAYFGSYSDRVIHEVMLRDKVRTEAYMEAILANAEALFRDKVVLDVGCGTGILSMFAAKAGARRVVAVDAADIIDKARGIVTKNGFANTITLVKGKVEEISLPADVTAVDVIISEWMGYFLVFESMLPSVLFARNKWLRRSDGSSAFAPASPETASLPFAATSTLFPDVANMYVSAIDTRVMRQETQDFWTNVYGFDMASLIHATDAFPGADVTVLSAGDSCRVSQVADLVTFDLLKTADADLDFKSSVTLTCEKDDVVDAFCVFFDVIFRRGCDKKEVVMTTSPAATPTHWKQTVFRLQRLLPVKAGDTIQLTLTASRRRDNHRFYNVAVAYTWNSTSGAKAAPSTSTPVMNTDWAVPGATYTQDYSLQ